MALLFNRLVIAGVGLIGGSLGLAARERGLVREVVGFGRTEANLKVALERGIITSYTFDPAEAARGTDLLLLAVPVEATGPVAQQFIPFLPDGCIITDAGSVKAPVDELRHYLGRIVGKEFRVAEGRQKDGGIYARFHRLCISSCTCSRLVHRGR